jgi:uncharacterized membrane protein
LLGFEFGPINGGFMGFGPVDIVIIDFPGNKFNGKIAPAILELVESGTIRLIDLLFISKDADGVVSVLAIEDLDPNEGPAFMALGVAYPGTLDSEDADELSDDLAPNSSALMVAFENTWAAKFTDAISASNARVLDQIRIPAEVVTNFLEAR